MNLEERLLYRDGLMLVIDKPAGIPVHAGPGGGENLEMGFESLRFGLPKLPALAHRLDRDTSGCLILGRHRKALGRLGKMFQAKRIDKSYIAVLPTLIEQDAGVIDVPLAKVHKYKGWKMKPAEAGDEAQESVTEYKVLMRANGRSLVAFYPRTGRTHQLRVHSLAAFGCAILGDTLYGDEQDKKQPRLLLHALSIKVPLYQNKPPIEVQAPVPSEFLAFFPDYKSNV